MPWWRFGRDQEAAPKQPPNPRATEEPAAAPLIRDAERRRLRRLLERRRNLEYDIEQAELAFQPANHWTERSGELDDAIHQAEADLRAVRPDAARLVPLQLPDLPITVVAVRTRDPAEVRLQVGDREFLFREEPDWAERGHQLALPQLTLAEGDVEQLVPDGAAGDQHERLVNHLRNGLAILADEALERAVDGEPVPSARLPELARPCPECGGWQDIKGRCPACVALDRKRAEIQVALARLIKERDGVAADMALARDRLPVFRRQLAETDQDIEKLVAKGVEPL